MKKLINRLTLTLILIFSVELSAQELFVENVNLNSNTKNLVNKYLNTSYFKNSITGFIDREILSGNIIDIKVPGGQILKFRRTEKYSDSEKWIGSLVDNDIKGDIIFIYSQIGFKGTINYGDQTYQITSIEGNNCVITEIEKSSYPMENCSNLIESYKGENYTLKSTTASTCKLRVLVAYTSYIAANVSDVISLAKLAVEETNQSYRNSGINHELELVGCIRVNYTESGYNTDLDRFTRSNDGYMDEIHTYRNNLSADICVLLFNNPSLCGIAAAIRANSNNAFCLVNYTCATGNFSFGHEIGHLQGARHDIAVDASTSPFSYGHGYISPNKNWRTIMAYGNACNNCSRKQYWSNPNIIYSDGYAMGNASANNAKVLNDETNRLKDFIIPFSDMVYTTNVRTKELHNVVAKNRITSCTSTVENTGVLNIFAGQEIILNDGFEIQSGGLFSAETGVTICN